MGKIQSYTSIVAVILILILLFLMVQPMDFLNKNLEEFYDANEGLIWFVGIILVILLTWRTYANGIYEHEIKKITAENKEKNNQIAIQNGKIIENQLTYIDQISELNQTINKNSQRDNETVKLLNELTESVDSLHRRIEDSEVKIKSHDIAIEKIKCK